MIKLYFIIGALILLIVFVIFLWIKNRNKLKAENKELKAYAKSIVDNEIKKGIVRSAHNETTAKILNDPTADNIVVMPVSKTEHNHGFKEPCASDCPAYSKD